MQVYESESEYREASRKIKMEKWNSCSISCGIIQANRFREKSDWEKMQEALITEEVIKELRDLVDLQGTTRKHGTGNSRNIRDSAGKISRNPEKTRVRS